MMEEDRYVQDMANVGITVEQVHGAGAGVAITEYDASIAVERLANMMEAAPALAEVYDAYIDINPWYGTSADDEYSQTFVPIVSDPWEPSFVPDLGDPTFGGYIDAESEPYDPGYIEGKHADAVLEGEENIIDRLNEELENEDNPWVPNFIEDPLEELGDIAEFVIDEGGDLLGDLKDMMPMMMMMMMMGMMKNFSK